MTEKQETIIELEAGMAAADEADQARFAAAIAYVETLGDDSPELVLYRALGRELWVPPAPPSEEE